jgi:Golgi SNAP receptor complex protein 2
MNRTLEDYDSMAKREMIKAKQEKAMMSVSPTRLICLPNVLMTYAHHRRVQKFRTDYNEFRSQFERLKAEVQGGEWLVITLADPPLRLENLS